MVVWKYYKSMVKKNYYRVQDRQTDYYYVTDFVYCSDIIKFVPHAFLFSVHLAYSISIKFSA